MLNTALSCRFRFKRVCEKVGIHAKSCHCFRHAAVTTRFQEADKATLARKLVDNPSLDEIAALLGHSSSKTTKGYVH